MAPPLADPSGAGCTLNISHRCRPKTMHHTTLFRSNRSHAVRLGKDVAFAKTVKEVTIIKEGARRVIVPAGTVWDDFFDSPGNELPDRDQPQVQQRDPL